MKIIFDEASAGYDHPSHPEKPQRVLSTRARLAAQTELPLHWTKPGPCPLETVLRAHTEDHLTRLKTRKDFDEDTPWHEHITEYALASVGATLTGLDSTLAGENAFSLMRPPGHHATRARAMGFCYLNNVAIAALEARARGLKQIAIFDFDVHHGNGTEAILLDVPGTLFYSVHQFPCYPGTGTRNLGSNCFNFPLPPQTARTEYRHVLADALEHLQQTGPDLVLVSAGFDGYIKDPLGQQALECEDFHWLGELLRQIQAPVLSVLEGGYSEDLPELVLSYLRGLCGRPKLAPVQGQPVAAA